MSTLNTLNLRPFASIPIGGEVVRFGEWPNGILRAVANLRLIHRRQVLVAGAVAAVAQELWNTANDIPTVFEFLGVIPDPDHKRDSDQAVDLRITNNAVTSTWRLSREVPFWLGPSAQTTGAVTLVEVLNLAATTPTTDDVEVGIVVLDDGV